MWLLSQAILALALCCSDASEVAHTRTVRKQTSEPALVRRESSKSVNSTKESPQHVRAHAVKLKVAFAVFVTDIGTRGWKDAVDILAYSIKKAAAKSKHHVDLIALTTEHLSASKEIALKGAGFKEVQKRPVPVPPDEICDAMSQEHMQRVMGHSSAHNTFLMAHETIKYWGLSFTNFDRVLVLDADTMVLDPMDELMERDEDFIGTYDHGLDVKSSTMPPTQGGFLLFRPNTADFDAIKDLTREGNWSGAGWKRSGIGYCYGGVGPDGLLSYYFNQDALAEIKRISKERLPEGIDKSRVDGSRMLAVDRAVYDVVLNKRLRDELEQKNEDRALILDSVKSVHFTGDCIKPWICSQPRGWFCEGLQQKWWALRGELEASRGLTPSVRGCKAGSYTPIGKANSAASMSLVSIFRRMA